MINHVKLTNSDIFMFVKEINSKEGSPLTGSIIFKQNQLPALNAGTGSITVEQTVSSKTDKVKAATYGNERKFAVNGPRFTLPPGVISSVFPPDNAQGEYDKVLPHVCLNRVTIPWERSISESSKKMLTEVPDQAPWLALLSVYDTDPAVKVSQVNLSGLKSASPTTSVGLDTLPKKYFHPKFDLNDNTEKLSDQCMVVDIPVGLFNLIAPSKVDLPWLAHVREIQPSNLQSIHYLEKLKGISDDKEAPQMATVIGNRLPLPGGKTTAYLVSFEGWESYLPSEGKDPKDNFDASITHVRLVLFKQWDIYAKNHGQSFFGYLHNLNHTNEQFKGSLLQLPPSDNSSAAGKAINNAFNMGLVPLNHFNRAGDETVSWYRGPFVPYDVKADEADLPLNGPDSCVEYNPDTGMLNVSYAAAWQLGQLLALQNGNFAKTLYDWKWKNTREVIAKFENEVINESLKEIVDKAAKKPLTVVKGSSSQDLALQAQANMFQLMNEGLGAILTGFMANKDKYPHEDK